MAKSPDYEINAVFDADSEEGKAHWVRLGAAWKSERAEGTITGQIDVIPIALFAGRPIRIVISPVRRP